MGSSGKICRGRTFERVSPHQILKYRPDTNLAPDRIRDGRELRSARARFVCICVDVFEQMFCSRDIFNCVARIFLIVLESLLSQVFSIS